MKAIIKGQEFEGTPQEIYNILKLAYPNLDLNE